jgi:hypothetical protein
MYDELDLTTEFVSGSVKAEVFIVTSYFTLDKNNESTTITFSE